ncbi:MAG: phospho-N-acetylmuramoyl-pentapeptide-transferase [bacterium]|nr:phospho-N-acetylmuramoyl-pentapeptide-transferase [bacterium]
MIPLLSFSVIKIALMASSAFLVAFLLTPWLTTILYKYKLWRKQVRQEAMGGGGLPIFKKFHQEGEIKTPRFGGVLIWITPPLLALVFFLLSKTGNPWFKELNFFSRSETWLPLATLVAASAVGFLDDILQVLSAPTNRLLRSLWEEISKYTAGGLSLRLRFTLVSLIGLAGAWWFFGKLGWDSVYVPFVGDVFLGWLMIPFFVLVMLATYSGGVIDGIDGLSGGAFASIFTAYGLISLSQQQIDLATLCFAIVGAVLAFLWFNIPPARFYMGETGIMGLTATLTVVAFLTDSVMVLPIIGILLVAESGSVIIQVASKKLRKGKKVFLAAPIHHHFEGKGWPSTKVTMRFWIVGIVAAFVGVAIRLIG